MATSSSTVLTIFAAIGYLGAFIVIIGIVFEASEFLLKAIKHAEFRSCVRQRSKRWLFLFVWLAKLAAPRALILEGAAIALIVGGLAIEWIGGGTAERLQTTENGELYKEAASATNMAAQAIAKAAEFEDARAQADRSRAIAEQETAIIQSNNLELQKELMPRTITMEQRTNFIFLTEKIHKISVKVAFAAGRNETVNFAYEIRDMLNKAGFPPETNAGGWGIDPEPNFMVHLAARGDTNWPSVVFYVYGTNSTFNVRNFEYERTNGFARPIIPEQDGELIGSAIMFDLNQIGVRTQEDADETTTIITKPGDFGLLVLDKAN